MQITADKPHTGNNKCADTKTSRHTQVPNLTLYDLVIGALLVSVQFFFWQRNVNEFLSPFHLVNCDQVAIFLTSYDCVREIQWLGKIPADFVHNLHSHQGPLLPLLSTVSVFCFGCTRTAGLLVNFLSLIAGEVLIYLSLRSGFGRPAALMGLGFFLLSGTHFLEFGGLNDLRRDYVGMLAFGISFLAVSRYVRKGGQRNFILVVLSLVLLDLARFIGLIYWIGGLALGIACSLLLGAVRPANKKTSLRLFGVLLATAAVGLVHIVASWDLFNQYYLQMNARGESQLRWEEFGVTTLAQRLLFYPNSFFVHFGSTLSCTALIVLGTGVVHLLKKKRSTMNTKSLDPCWILASLLFASYTILTLHTASPIVLGIYTIPIALCAAVVCITTLSTWLGRKSLLGMAVAISAAGVFFSFSQLIRPTHLPHPHPKSSLAVSALMNRLVDTVTTGQKVYWLLYHDGLHPPAFLIRWYEKRQEPKPLVEHFQFLPFPVEPLPKVLHQISQSDFVIAPISIPVARSGWFEYPGIKALREYLPTIQNVLDKDFSLVQSYPGVVVTGPDEWSIGLYKRKFIR